MSTILIIHTVSILVLAYLLFRVNRKLRRNMETLALAMVKRHDDQAAGSPGSRRTAEEIQQQSEAMAEELRDIVLKLDPNKKLTNAQKRLTAIKMYMDGHAEARFSTVSLAVDEMCKRRRKVN